MTPRSIRRRVRTMNEAPCGFPRKSISQQTWQRQWSREKWGQTRFCAKPFGEGWGRNVVDVVNKLPDTVFSELPEFQNLPRKVRAAKNYTGSTEMHCDPDLEGEPIETRGTRWNRLQADVLDLLGRSVALPVTWAARALEGTQTNTVP